MILVLFRPLGLVRGKRYMYSACHVCTVFVLEFDGFSHSACYLGARCIQYQRNGCSYGSFHMGSISVIARLAIWFGQSAVSVHCTGAVPPSRVDFFSSKYLASAELRVGVGAKAGLRRWAFWLLFRCMFTYAIFGWRMNWSHETENGTPFRNDSLKLRVLIIKRITGRKNTHACHSRNIGRRWENFVKIDSQSEHDRN